jgi:hypothetical protein
MLDEEGSVSMPHIVLTDEQSQVVDRAKEPVEVRHKDGSVVAQISPKGRGATGPWYSGDQVQEYLRLLEEEASRTGHCDEARARQILAQFTPVR